MSASNGDGHRRRNGHPKLMGDVESAQVVRACVETGQPPPKDVRDRLPHDWREASLAAQNGDDDLKKWFQGWHARDPGRADEMRRLFEASRANGKGDTPPNGDGIADATTRSPGGPNEAEDDPHRLARVYRDASCEHPDGLGLTLRSYQGEWLRWAGAWRPAMEKDIRAELCRAIKAEFDRINLREIEAMNGRRAAPQARKVTGALVGNVALALAGYTQLPGPIAHPAWLTDSPPFPAAEALPARNALVHLPSLVAKAEGARRPPTPQFFCPYALDYDFDPGAPEPANWLTFLGARSVDPGGPIKLQLWPDDRGSIETLQEWMGLNLVADTRYQKILALIGPRRSGKGTLARVLIRLVGPENVANPTLAQLGTNFGLSPLIGKLAAVIGDARLSGRADIAQVVERLLSISGEDSQTIDRKHLPAWTGRMTARFTIISNEIPRLAESSGALAGRMLILRLTRSFYGKEDQDLLEKLLPELPGILLWAIEGWRRLRERGCFVQPDSGKPLVEEMEDLSSPTGMFVKECCVVEPGRSIPVADLFARWKSWCQEKNKEHAGDESTFGRNLRTVVSALTTKPVRRGGKYHRVFEGIDLEATF